MNKLIPLLCKPEGMGRNELLVEIGKSVFHVWAIEKYNKFISEKGESTFNKKSFDEFYNNLDIELLNKADLGDMLLNG